MLKLCVEEFLRRSSPFYRISCSVSTKYEIVKPRPYRRRLFEAALLPEVPEVNESCSSWRKNQEQRRIARTEYTEMELAFVKHIREWINTEGFRMLAVCQFLPVKGRAEWLAKNQFRLKGLELRKFDSRTMLKLLEGTCLEPLSVLFKYEDNCCLFGKEVDSLRSVIKECKRYSWIEPLGNVLRFGYTSTVTNILLALTFDSRILSVSEVEKLCRLGSLEHLRLETISILETFSHQSLSMLSSPSNCLSNTLTYMSSSKSINNSST
uniref:Large ribosomal subunit protein uL10m n=1 Tax=Syphacia muris TaxID=451379 RepID=A0A0N5ADW9_9BILA